MPVDAGVIYALTEELNPVLAGAKIDRVQQPERDMLLLSLRTNSGSRKLLISGAVGSARIHFTAVSYENPVEAPMFCMLMRKHLVGARIRRVFQPDFERMADLELECRDEMGDLAVKHLIVEMMGRSSNVILVDSDGRIVDCMRRMDFGGDAERRMLPGMIYRLPPKQTGKIPFFTSADEVITEALKKFTDEEPLNRQLMKTFAGLSPLLARELEYGSGSADELPVTAAALRELVKEERFTPFLLTENNTPAELSFTRIMQYGSAMTGEVFADFSSLLDAFFARREKAEIQKRKGRELTHSVKTARDRIARKLAGQTEELKRTEKRDEIRKEAELLTANLYRVRKGDRAVVCQDYYDEALPDVTIQLDPLKTPQQNSAALFREYNKLKTAREYLTVLVAQGEAQLDYLNSVLEELALTESEKDISDIRSELTAAGFLRTAKQKNEKRNKPQTPHLFRSKDGFEILAGRSNIQNDELTKGARRTDYWFHAQKIHGSHVILRTDGLEPTEDGIAAAAAVAAWYSQGRGAKVAVDYTMVRFVRKPSGSLPGKVVYTDYRTVYSEPDEDNIAGLRTK